MVSPYYVSTWEHCWVLCITEFCIVLPVFSMTYWALAILVSANSHTSGCFCFERRWQLCLGSFPLHDYLRRRLLVLPLRPYKSHALVLLPKKSTSAFTHAIQQRSAFAVGFIDYLVIAARVHAVAVMVYDAAVAHAVEKLVVRTTSTALASTPAVLKDARFHETIHPWPSAVSSRESSW